MSKGNIIIVVNKVNKKVIESVTEKVKPYLSEVGDAIQFSFEDLEVDLTKKL